MTKLKKLDIHQVAKRAEVSTATVSPVLDGVASTG